MKNNDSYKKNQYRHKTGQTRPQQRGAKKLSANLWGIHAVREAWLNPERKIRGLYATEQGLQNIADIIDQRKTPPSIMEKADMDRLLPKGAVHQGIALHAEMLPEVFIQDLIIKAQVTEKESKKSVLLMLDQVTDPHNVGAIMRSASAFGATGMIMQRRHSPELVGVLAKTACGAVEHINSASVTNLSDTLDTLREAGFLSIGLDERGESTIGEFISAHADHNKIVLVLGAEGSGLRPKVREHCDVIVKLPTQGAIASLNVSNAAAVSLYAVLAQK